MDIPAYTDEVYWNSIIQQYIEGRCWFALDIENHLWNYFKFCLKKNNPFFFQHPLIPLLESIFSKHVYVLHNGIEIYRAREDKDHCLWDEWQDYTRIDSTPKAIKRLENRHVNEDIIQNQREQYEAFLNDARAQQIKARVESGFQGFDANGSSAPPYDKAIAGRCNPKGVAYLYAALEEHTAVAEIRPHIQDTISIAQLKPIRDLRLINFDYDPTAIIPGEDFLFHNIQMDFSVINKNKSDDYLVTQYMTALIEHLGYDGLCFRSSLVKNGTNYVIFNPANCSVISSNLCYLSEVRYVYQKCK